MSPQGSRQVVDRYIKGLIDRNLDLQAEVCAPDMIQEFPQSGERIRGWANYRAAAENYPGGLPEGMHSRVVGSDDRWVLGPSFTLLRIEGTGDVYTFFGNAKYPDGVTWHVMSIIEVRSAKIAKTTWVFGAPFDPPASRAQWVERLA